MDKLKAIQFEVTGIVQGVNFRRETAKHAKTIGVRGWIANHDAGHVEGVAIGSQTQLEKFKQYISRGPKYAQVERVDILGESDVDAGEVVDSFTVKH